ncbi:MAG: hypothetical protein AVO34_02080 [Firmicutes bacterium ML8_F2]|jgi:hypothetical protein|nr:MAG: hypothetical protein AVO34_02080 [Firmicutes bacterium ML8_F2]
MAIRDFLTNFHIGAASGWDLFIVLIFLIAVLVYGFFLGRNRMIILLLSSYFSLAIVEVLPWERISSLSWLGVGSEPSSSLKILIFAGIILLFYFLIPRSILSSTLRIRNRGEASWLQLFILSIVQVGLLAMVIFSFLPSQPLGNLSYWIKKAFVDPEARFVWIALPILVMVLMRRRKKPE